MKFLLKFVLALIFVVVLTVFFAGGWVVKTVINHHSERLTGLDISVAGAEVNFLSGQFSLSNLAIANPEGFESPNAALIKNVQITLQPETLTKDVVVVDLFAVDGLRVQFEGDMGSNNVQEIQKILAQKVEKNDHDDHGHEEHEHADEELKEQKKVAIRQLSITDTSVAFNLGGMKEGVNVPVSDIQMTNIGTADKGATAQEVLDKILLPLFENLHRAVIESLSNPQNLIDKMKGKVGGVLDGLFK